MKELNLEGSIGECNIDVVCEEIFKNFDLNGDGVITREELLETLKKNYFMIFFL